jgi:hypothetical protein
LNSSLERVFIGRERFRSIEEIDIASDKLRRRVQELEAIDIVGSVQKHTGAITVAKNNIRDTIREVFGPNSPEYKEHENLRIWVGASRRGMTLTQVVAQTQRGQSQVIGILNGLIARLQDKKTDLAARTAAPPRAVPFDRLNIHQRIHGVSRELFLSGHPWEGVFAASKALINYVKEPSNQYELDGAQLREPYSLLKIRSWHLTISLIKPIAMNKKEPCICSRVLCWRFETPAVTPFRKALNSGRSSTFVF